MKEHGEHRYRQCHSRSAGVMIIGNKRMTILKSPLVMKIKVCVLRTT